MTYFDVESEEGDQLNVSVDWRGYLGCIVAAQQVKFCDWRKRPDSYRDEDPDVAFSCLTSFETTSKWTSGCCVFCSSLAPVPHAGIGKKSCWVCYMCRVVNKLWRSNEWWIHAVLVMLQVYSYNACDWSGWCRWPVEVSCCDRTRIQMYSLGEIASKELYSCSCQATKFL